MEIQTTNLESELIEHNQLDTKKLFTLYNDLHFIYPAKMERLQPVFEIVEKTWNKALTLNFPLFWVSTIKPNQHHILATGSAWQYLNKGMIAQHLASNHPMGSRMIFLGMLDKVIENQHTGIVDSYQIYYRPQNKYSAKIFEPLSLKAGKKLSEIIPYNYFDVPFIKNYSASTSDIEIIEITRSGNEDFINFLKEHRSELFIKALELNSDDLNLSKLNSKFKNFGLRRGRRIFVAKSFYDDKIYGLIIINQSSPGFNFSLIENSCELILRKQSPPPLLLKTARSLLFKAAQLNEASPLKYLPVLTDPAHTEIIETLKGQLTRSYNLFIMLKGGYEMWYEHVDQLTDSVFKRFMHSAYENS